MSITIDLSILIEHPRKIHVLSGKENSRIRNKIRKRTFRSYRNPRGYKHVHHRLFIPVKNSLINKPVYLTPESFQEKE